MSNRTAASLLLIVVMLVWGSSFTVTKASLAEVPPMLFALLRFGVASVLLLALAQARRGSAKVSRPAPWGTVALMGLTGVTLYYVGYNLSLYYATASQSAMIQSAIPAVTASLAFMFLKERLSLRRVLGIGLSIIGVLLILIVAAPSADARNPPLGGVLMFGAVVVWSVYTILAKQLADFDQLLVTAYVTAIGAALLVPITLFELLSKSLPAISVRGFLSVLYLGAVSSAGGYLLYNRSLKHLDASQAAAYINLLPVVGVATAVLFLGESLVAWQLLGGALVLLGTWLSSSTIRCA
jgi:drug/metabolite transporter (DMT)-like permease